MNSVCTPPKPSTRVASLQPSATVEMTERVRQARASGRKIIGLSSGDPALKTDDRIVAAALRAIERGETHYSNPAGQIELRAAIARRERARCGVQYDADDILITPGGKFALLAALMGIIEPGDEVIVLEPGWVSYGPCVRLCGGVPIALQTLDRLDLDGVRSVLNRRSRAIILNSPVNPTGRILSAGELRETVAIAQQHGMWILFDQVYADLAYGKTVAFPQAMDGGRDCTLVIDSLSKTFGMTGWRLGYVALPSPLAKPVLKFLQHSIYCVPQFIQAAGVEALSLHDELAVHYRDTFGRRMIHAARELSKVDGIRCEMSDGTFYLFPRIAGDDVATARLWLDAIDVATMPGSAFGRSGAGHLRLSLTCSEAELDEALNRITQTGIVR